VNTLWNHFQKSKILSGFALASGRLFQSRRTTRLRHLVLLSRPICWTNRAFTFDGNYNKSRQLVKSINWLWSVRPLSKSSTMILAQVVFFLRKHTCVWRSRGGWEIRFYFVPIRQCKDVNGAFVFSKLIFIRCRSGDYWVGEWDPNHSQPEKVSTSRCHFKTICPNRILTRPFGVVSSIVPRLCKCVWQALFGDEVLGELSVSKPTCWAYETRNLKRIRPHYFPVFCAQNGRRVSRDHITLNLIKVEVRLKTGGFAHAFTSALPHLRPEALHPSGLFVLEIYSLELPFCGGISFE
jgi:hypothetical protein